MFVLSDFFVFFCSGVVIAEGVLRDDDVFRSGTPLFSSLLHRLRNFFSQYYNFFFWTITQYTYRWKSTMLRFPGKHTSCVIRNQDYLLDTHLLFSIKCWFRNLKKKKKSWSK